MSTVTFEDARRALAVHAAEESRPKRMDPNSCGCLDCTVTGYSVAMEFASAEDFLGVAQGTVVNFTGYTATELLAWMQEHRS